MSSPAISDVPNILVHVSPRSRRYIKIVSTWDCCITAYKFYCHRDCPFNNGWQCVIFRLYGYNPTVGHRQSCASFLIGVVFLYSVGLLKKLKTRGSGVIVRRWSTGIVIDHHWWSLASSDTTAVNTRAATA